MKISMGKMKKEVIIEDLCDKSKVIGLKQVVKHAQKKELEIIYLASDVDSFINEKVLTVAEENRIPVREAESMVKLGETCGIEVGAACVGILRIG